MLFEKVMIVGVAHVEAPHRIASTVFEERLAETIARLGMRPDPLRALAGIEARRWWDEGVEPDEAAALAGEKVLAQTGIDRARVGVIFNTSVCREYLEPSTACMVHGRLGLSPDCANYDLGNACLAFLNAMELAGTMLERGAIDYALVVDGEGSRNVQQSTLARLARPETTAADFRAEFATLTLGSGAVAMLLSREDLHPEAHRIRGGVSQAATQWSHLCRGTLDKMTTDTATLLTEGVSLAMRTWQAAQKVLGWCDEVLDHLVLHQVSKVHTHKLCQTLGLNPDKAILTFPEMGNVGPAAVPMTLSAGVEAGTIRAGDRVALMGIGSGLNVSMMEIIW
ncbi:MAG: 3-oxoacyl-ACP synthase III [Myxococcales bacterium]|nr:3-oxoacyl-ACP synthase III [Myxococcales bacterium]